MTIDFSLKNLPKAIEDFAFGKKNTSVIAFEGEMGAGKTTFIGALCKHLGVVDVTSSPTYGIINHYKTGAGDSIYHLDLYRLKDEEEAIAAGVEDVLYSNALCLIEWPNVAAGLLPENTLFVKLSILENGMRRLIF